MLPLPPAASPPSDRHELTNERITLCEDPALSTHRIRAGRKREPLGWLSLSWFMEEIMKAAAFAQTAAQAGDTYVETFGTEIEPTVVIRAGEFGASYPVDKIKISQGRIILQFDPDKRF